MSVSDVLEGLQRRLQAATAPTVARHAVAGIFATLRKAGISADARAAAISLCLSRPNKVVVQEAAEQLFSLTASGGLAPADAVEFLLSAITTAGSAAAAAPLVDGLCRLVVTTAPAPASSPAHPAVSGPVPSSSALPAPLRPSRWTSHPLVAALLSCPAAATQLLTSAVGALTAAATAAAAASAGGAAAGAVGVGVGGGGDIAAAGAALDRTWAALEPFFSFVLLQRHSGGAAATTERPSISASPSSATAATSAALAAWLHSQLVRLACSDTSISTQGTAGAPGAAAGAGAAGGPPGSWLRLRLLHFLTGHLALGPRGTEVDRMHAVASTTDLLDVLEALLDDIEVYDGDPDSTNTPPTAAATATTTAAAATAAAHHVAGVLLQLAFEVLLGTTITASAAAGPSNTGGGGGGGGAGGGGGGGGSQVVGALLRLQVLVPGALAGHVAALSLLTLSAYGKELLGLHLLLHKAIQRQQEHLPGPPQRAAGGTSHSPDAAAAATAATATATAALSLQPLLAAVAFSTAPPTSPAAAWPAHLATALQRVMTPSSAAPPAPTADGCDASSDGSAHTYGDLCLHTQCRRTLLSLWAAAESTTAEDTGDGDVAAPPPCDLLRWLGSLELALRQRRRAAAAARAASEQLPFATRINDVVSEAALGAADAHPAVTCLVAALLAHTDPRVRVAAASAARALIQLLPAAALPLLPLVMYQLQRGSVVTAASASTNASANAAAQLALLQVLPVMAADPWVAPYALRVLQPMLQPGAPEGLRCVALKLVCDTWLLSGRGWPQVEAALNGLSPPGARDPPPGLRVTRAALLRAVCDRDPGRGVELVSALQQCLTDPGCPPAVALGLEALGVLVEEDVLDFYAAYRVVHRWHPGLPAHPLVASRWVALLAHGSLDAEAHPDKAPAILDILWSATRHPCEQVRAAAYTAISCYPPDVLERLEILRPLSQYTAPLLSETDPRVSGAARQLAAVALRFEHANRRRLLLTQPAADSKPNPAATTTATTAAADAADGSDRPTTATAGGSGGARGGGAAYAAAAAAREARALRGRFLGRIPKLLLAGSSPASGPGRPGASATAAISTGSFHPGAVLFCYSRAPPPALPPGASAAAAAAAAKRAAAEAREAYGQRLRDGLRRLGWRGSWHPRLAVQAWAAFVRRWMYDTGLTAAAAAAALVAEWDGTGAAATATAAAGGGGGGNGAGGGAVTAATSGAVTAAAPAAVLESVGLAVGALCVAADGLREADVGALVTRLLQQAQSGRSSGITRSALVGAALAATRLHPTDWAARQQVLSELRVQLLTAPGAVVRSAAATALGVLVGSLAADPAVYIRAGGTGGGNSGGGDGADHSRELVAVSEAVSYLATTLGTLCPQLAPAIAELAASGMPPGWPQQDESAYRTAPKPLKDEQDEQEVLTGTAVALASLLCDVNRAHGLPAGALTALLTAMVNVAAGAVASDGAQDASGGGGGGGLLRRRGCSGSAAAAAALEAVAVLAPEALRYQQLSANELSSALKTVRRLCSAGVVADGRVRGAAAYCLGCAAATALRQGMVTEELVSELGLAASASASQPADATATAAAALSTLVSELADQATGASAAAAVTAVSGGGGGGVRPMGQHTAAARTGAVAGLAALLAPPPPSLVDALAPIPPGAAGSGLLAQPEYLAPAKAATRALEGLASEDTDPWVASAAAFHLASVAAAVAAAEGADDATGPAGAGGGADGTTSAAGGVPRGGGGGSAAGGAGGAGPKALSLYPPEGAVRPLVVVLMDRSRLATTPRAALADTLMALAAAPALPAADWPTACRTLLAAATSTPSASATSGGGDSRGTSLRLQAATLLMALSHGSVPSLGLGALLEELVAPARFAALAPAVQALLLARLPALLRSLAVKRAAAVVQSLPGLLATAAAAVAADSGDGVSGSAAVAWSSPAGLDDPGLMVPWLRRVRQGLLGPSCGADLGGGGGGATEWLAAHCWLGLLGVCRAWQAKDAALVHRDITQAAHTAITSLASQLQPLQPLQPGEAAQLLAWAATAAPVTAGGGGGGAAAVLARGAGDEWESYGPAGRPLENPATEGDGALDGATSVVTAEVAAQGGRSVARAGVTLWALAACCLRCLRPDFLTAQVLTEPSAATVVAAAPQAVASLQLRCVLVAIGHVSYRELMPVRTAVAGGAASSASRDAGDPLLALLSLALAGTPQAFQVQVLLQTLDGARVSLQQQPQQQKLQEQQHLFGPSLELAAALVAACVSHAAGAAAAMAPELCLALTSRRAALECLPYTLPRLLSRPPWSSSCEAVAQALLAVAREGLGKEGGVRGGCGAGRRAQEGGRSGDGAGDALQVVLTCLWALRDVLPGYTYDQMHAALGWKVLVGMVKPVAA